MTTQQQLLFTYFSKTILKSTTITEITIYADKSIQYDAKGNIVKENKIGESAAAQTFLYTAPVDVDKSTGMKIALVPARNEIIIPGTTMVDGNMADTEKGVLPFTKEHALLHEFAHADRKSTRLNSSHSRASRMPSSA